MITQHTRRTVLTRIGAGMALVGVMAAAGCAPSSSDTAATTSSARAGPHAEPARRRHVQRGGQLLHQRPSDRADRVVQEPVRDERRRKPVRAQRHRPQHDPSRRSWSATRWARSRSKAPTCTPPRWPSGASSPCRWTCRSGATATGNRATRSSPDIYAEDFSAAVDYLRTQSFVDSERIGALGICGSGSFVISAAKIDPRIKSVATVSMYDMGAANRDGLRNARHP